MPYSPSDPEARISVKPGKARALNYLCSLAVVKATGVISHIQADIPVFASKRGAYAVSVAPMLLAPPLFTPLRSRLAVLLAFYLS